MTAHSDDALPDKAASNEAQSLDRSASFNLGRRDDTSLSSIPASQSAVSSTTLAVSKTESNPVRLMATSKLEAPVPQLGSRAIANNRASTGNKQDICLSRPLVELLWRLAITYIIPSLMELLSHLLVINNRPSGSEMHLFTLNGRRLSELRRTIF
jgi:hypothetical protein